MRLGSTALVALIVLTACGSTADTASVPEGSGPAGVTGTVTIDGGCPVIAEPEGCPRVALSAHVEIRPARSQAPVASTDTSADGGFRLAVDPGRYVLVVTVQQALPSGQVQQLSVHVPQTGYATVDVGFDSGIRAAQQQP